MLCQMIVDSVSVTINDPNNVVFSLDQKIAALNEAILATAMYRPDAAVVMTNIAVANGSKQNLPSDCVRLLKVIRNLNGSAVGKSVRLMNLDRISDRVSDWHTQTGSDVLEYAYEIMNPLVFWVFPSLISTTNRYLEIMYQKALLPITSGSEEFPLSAIYFPAVKEWMLYVLWGGDDEQSPSYAKALKRQESFFNLLQVKTASDVSSPSDDKARSA